MVNYARATPSRLRGRFAAALLELIELHSHREGQLHLPPPPRHAAHSAPLTGRWSFERQRITMQTIQKTVRKAPGASFVRRAAVARRLGVTSQTLRRWCDDGRLPRPTHITRHIVGWDSHVIEPVISELL